MSTTAEMMKRSISAGAARTDGYGVFRKPPLHDPPFISRSGGRQPPASPLTDSASLLEGLYSLLPSEEHLLFSPLSSFADDEEEFESRSDRAAASLSDRGDGRGRGNGRGCGDGKRSESSLSHSLLHSLSASYAASHGEGDGGCDGGADSADGVVDVGGDSGSDGEDGGGGCGEDAGRKSYGGWGALVVGCSDAPADASRARLKGFGRRGRDGGSRGERLSSSARRRRRERSSRACSDGGCAGNAGFI